MTELVPIVVQEKKNKNGFGVWLTCCLAGKENPTLNKKKKKKKGNKNWRPIAHYFSGGILGKFPNGREYRFWCGNPVI